MGKVLDEYEKGIKKLKEDLRVAKDDLKYRGELLEKNKGRTHDTVCNIKFYCYFLIHFLALKYKIENKL